jgi:hypothetical protein
MNLKELGNLFGRSTRPAQGIGVLLLAALCAPGAKATVIYTYTGNDFTTVIGSYTTADFVSGSFTVSSQLAANLSLAPITPLTFNFTDGTQVLNNSTSVSQTFDVSTDSTGDITSWDLALVILAGGDYIYTINNSGTIEDVGQQNFSNPDLYTFGSNSNNAGTWIATPEPSTVSLTSMALLALATRSLNRFSARRKRRNNKIQAAFRNFSTSATGC